MSERAANLVGGLAAVGYYLTATGTAYEAGRRGLDPAVAAALSAMRQVTEVTIRALAALHFGAIAAAARGRLPRWALGRRPSSRY